MNDAQSADAPTVEVPEADAADLPPELAAQVERILRWPGAHSLTVNEIEKLARGPRTMRLAAKGELARRVRKGVIER